MLKEIEDFYRELFTTSNRSSLSHVLQSIPTSIDENMNLGLISEVTNEEIKEAIFSMHPNKSPGIGGMTPLFFQQFWPLIYHDVCLAVRYFFKTGQLLPV